MTATPINANATGSLSARARDWLAGRALDADLCEQLGIASRPARDGKSDVLIFPFEREGRIVNRKYRDTAGKKFAQDKGGEQILWRHDVIADEGLASEPLVITEGELDAVVAVQAGYWRTVAFAAGAPEKPTEEGKDSAKYACLDAAREALDGATEIILAVDGDQAGVALLTDLQARLGPARCKFVTYPRGCKDLNDVLLAQGIEGVRNCLAGAKWVRARGVFRLSELPPLPPLKIWKPDLHKASGLDDLLTICPGQVSVWTGYAGEGKSTLLNAATWSIARREDFALAVGTFEATPQREYLNDAIAFLAGKPLDLVTEEERERATQWVEDHCIFLNGDGYGKPGSEEWIDQTFDWFIDSARAAIVRYGARIAILDPWSQIDHDYDSREREDLYVRRTLKRAKMFARSFDVHLAIVAHPKNPIRNRDGSYDVPDGYSVSGGAHWKNAPDFGVTAFRDPPMIEIDGEYERDPNSSRTLIRVWKKKNHRLMGKPGECYVQLDCNTGRYHSAETFERTNTKGRGG
jgi:twinkle protein